MKFKLLFVLLLSILLIHSSCNTSARPDAGETSQNTEGTDEVLSENPETSETEAISVENTEESPGGSSDISGAEQMLKNQIKAFLSGDPEEEEKYRMSFLSLCSKETLPVEYEVVEKSSEIRPDYEEALKKTLVGKATLSIEGVCKDGKKVKGTFYLIKEEGKNEWELLSGSLSKDTE